MMWKFFGLFALACLLSACQAPLDSDMARMCRIAIPVLEPQGNHIEILSQAGEANRNSETYSVEIAYLSKESAGLDHKVALECVFETKTGFSPADRLVIVSRDTTALSDVQLFMLQRFWLKSRAASLDDPQSVAGQSGALSLSFPLAYALQHLLNALPLAAIYGLLAISYSLIYGLIGRINLAFGEMAALGSYATVIVLLSLSTAWPLLQAALAIAAALYASGLHGAVLSRLVFLPLSRGNGQQALVGSIGLAVFLQEYLRLTQGNEQRWSAPLFHTPIAVARAADFVVTLSPVTILVSLIGFLAAIGVLVLMKSSQFGKNWRAYSDDPLAAELFGINPQTLFLATFTLACGCAGLAGACLTLYFGGLGFGASTTLGLKALVAAILGGIGSIPGALCGGLLVAAIETLWSAYFLIDYRDLVIFSLLTLALVLRPHGLANAPDIPRRQMR